MKPLSALKSFRSFLSRISLRRLGANVYSLVTFVLLLMLYQTFKKFFPWRLIPVSVKNWLEPRANRLYILGERLLDRHNSNTISRSDLIELAFRNMQAKKTRTLVTVGGMAIGVGAIVFLVSIGYGLQQLVISRVARLDEMRQADVYPQSGGAVKINDGTLSNLKEIANVEAVLPLIAAVGRVNYQNSVSDMAVFGVTADYLNQSAIKPVRGEIFASNDIISKLDDDNLPIDFPGPSQDLGFVTAETASPAATSAVEQTNFIEIASLSAQTDTREVKKMSLKRSSVREAIVNRAALKVLGIEEESAVGKTFEASFIIVGDSLADNKDRLESYPAEYKIVGVVSDEKTPVFYVAFIDLRQLTVLNYSQLKVVAKNQGELAKVRRLIEAQGYLTRSVADTVAQISSLFATLRAVLLLIGTVALAVASLGMFNTLTVSLLERTREVGLIKAMGMKSSEVRELFLTESMIMGFYGGLFGIIFGFAGGKILGILISIFAVAKGVGMVDIAYLPPQFLVVILILSLFVGIVTGIYPAYRTTKISALNALRYE